MTGDGVSLTFFLEDDSTGELHVTVRSKGFSGRSSAWFAVDELRAFASALAAFPVGEDASRGIAGGYFARTGGLEQVHVAISVLPTDGRGTLGARVRVATPSPGAIAGHVAEVEFKTTYGALASFSAQLSRLGEGRVSEAALLADDAT